MPKQLAAFFQRLSGSVRAFSAAQKTIAILAIAVLALGAVFLGTWLSTPQYTPLFTGLAAADASAVVDQLNADGVKYQLTDGGATVLVPQDKVYDERLKAASAGLPSSSTSGYALLDKMGVTSSEFQQDVMYKQAMEEELAKTIQAMNGVQTASVKLAIPKATVFTAQAADPTASVFIKTDVGATLSSDQVDAIVHLTSASVENMKPADVTVVDSSGQTLSAQGGGATGSSDKLTSAYEAKTTSAIQAMLDRIVGPGNSTVAVSAALSDATSQRVSETFQTPTNAPVLSETNQVQTFSGSGSSAAGVLGPDNIAVPNGAGGNGSYKASNGTKNNAINKVTQTDDIPAGTVQRQTVSVAISSKALGAASTASIQSLVESAAGFDKTRGDVVTVAAVNFNQDQAKAAQAALNASAKAQQAEQAGNLLRDAVIAGAVVLVAALALIYFLRRGRQRREPVDLEIFGGDDEADEMDAILAGRNLAIEQPVPMPVLEPTTIEVKRAEIATLAGRDPGKAAEILRGLMDERTS
jgi:flagellar M-ring protein FliF